MSQPLISIVTPTWNRRHLLERTLASVASQTFRDFEHIVVDGGSTDGTLELLERSSEAYPLRWVSEPDRGMYDAINKGLKLSSGQIVAYLNSDDLYFPWTLEVVANTFARRRDADFVYGDAVNVDDDTGFQRIYWMLPFSVDFVRRFRCLLQPVVFWKRDVLDRFGYFDDSIGFVADCEFWMRTGEKSRFIKVNEFLAIERDHAGTLRETSARAAGASIPRGSEDGYKDELNAVRSRYITMDGSEHENALRLHARWARLWSKVYGLAFAIQATLPRSVRRRPWARFLAAGQPTLSRIRLFMMHIPRFGGRWSVKAFPASRYWLEPPLDVLRPMSGEKPGKYVPS